MSNGKHSKSKGRHRTVDRERRGGSSKLRRTVIKTTGTVLIVWGLSSCHGQWNGASFDSKPPSAEQVGKVIAQR